MIEVRELTKTYGGQRAVDRLSFTAPPGAVTGFLGPNGAGKTTTFRCLLGLAEATSGTALIDGRAYRDLVSPRRQVGAVLESTGFHPGRSGRDHLRVIARGAGLDADIRTWGLRRSRVRAGAGTSGIPTWLSRRSRGDVRAGAGTPGWIDSLLDLVGLAGAADRRVGGYSLGMRQRLGLAAAMLGDPAVLVLDEPANGLDPGGVRWVRELLRTWADDGRTVVVSSHLLAEVAQVVDRVVVIGEGRLVAETDITELTSRGETLEEMFLRVTAETAATGGSGGTGT